MKEAAGKQWIEKLRKRWIVFSFGRVLLISLTCALIASALLFQFYGVGTAGFLLPFVFVFLALSLYGKYWKISATSISRFIDLHFPDAEESSGLLLKPASELSFLEHLQAQKVNTVLAIKKQPLTPLRQLKIPFVFMLAGIAFSLFITHLPIKRSMSAVLCSSPKEAVAKVKENVPPQISSFELGITPPAYTGKTSRTQQQFTILAESGSRISWKINIAKGLKKLSFIFNDNEMIPLKAVNKERTSWFLSRMISHPGFYQVLLDDKRSDFYQIEVIPDQPVVIQIIRPAQHTTIDIGRPQQFNLGVVMNDDYGIADAYISATMASGKGEAVSFKEKKLSFNLRFGGQKQVKTNQLISLKELGMKPGDELYYYVSARDNRGQQSRSDMYFISIQDTTELMSMTGIDNGVNLVPEYFRSERQLIIDTEKLLKEESGLTDVEFKRRSNDLGIDQKMLRLRYGKFLGEEEESGGHDHADEHRGAEPEQFGNVQSIMDQYAHKHDNAEDATFFEPALKAQLKATLTEMWNAELRLRTYVPGEALPYEYKALRLLKDLQQKSRAYVAKTTVRTSPLKPEKRLTAELSDIKGGLTKSVFDTKGTSLPVLKQAIGSLENMKAGQPRTTRDVSALLAAQRELTAAAAVSPA
ncbi:MAG TPA: DUF4175 family protein, partial [Pedobacter sp.]